MKWEYRQWVVPTKGMINIKLPENYLNPLNQLSQRGWEVDQMVPIHSGISGTTAFVFLLKRAYEKP